METEIFKDIVGYEGKYQVSNLGNVKSLERIDGNKHLIKEKILKKELTKCGYLNNTLSKFGKTKRFLIHRLVCLTFLPNIENKETVNHINGIKTDNRLENLEWNTHSENGLHKCRILLKKPKNIGKFGKENYRSRKVEQLQKDGTFIKIWNCITDIERELFIRQTNIGSVCRGITKTAGGFKWKYLNS